MTALLAVTTDFPAAIARMIKVRAGSMPPITSTTNPVGVVHHLFWVGR